MTARYLLKNTVSGNGFCQQHHHGHGHCHQQHLDQPTANIDSQLSIATLEGNTIFLAQPAAAPPSAAAAVVMDPPDPWSVHVYNHCQQACLNGEEIEPIMYGVPSQPHCPAVAVNTYSLAAPMQHHQPLYGCGCVECVAFFSSPAGQGYLSPLTHFNDEASPFSEATPGYSFPPSAVVSMSSSMSFLAISQPFNVGFHAQN